jgi:hypothetical protein
MVKSGVRLLTIILVCLTSQSCHEKISWDFPDFEPVPTVNSFIVAGKHIWIHVSLAGKFDTAPIKPIENATVELYVDGEYAETLGYVGDSFYKSGIIAQTQKEYMCKVIVPSFPIASSTCIIPNPENILGIEHINKAGVDEEGVPYPAVKVTFSNNPNALTYFEIVISLIREEYISKPDLLNIIDPVLLNEGLPILVFSNELLESESYTMTINYTTGGAEHTDQAGWQAQLYPIRVELRTVCHSYYRYARQLYLYENSNDDPFLNSGILSSFQLYSNVDNGYGIFTGYSVVESEIIYP